MKVGTVWEGGHDHDWKNPEILLKLAMGLPVCIHLFS